MNVHISGATSFIGKAFIQYCQNYPHILINRLDRKSLETLNVNKLKGSNSFIHLAARVHVFNEESGNYLREYLETNRDLTLSLAKKAIEARVKKFIFISSVAVYGRFKGGVISLNDNPRPDDPYGESKLEAEKGLVDLFAHKESKCIILRLPMVYGPENKGNMLRLLNAASRRIPLPLGAVRSKRSVVYVKNVCSAILKILQDEKPERPTVQTYLINDRQDITSGQLYSEIYRAYRGGEGVFSIPEVLFRLSGNAGTLIEKLLKKRLPINEDVVSRLIDEYRFSSEAFRRDYDWNPPYSQIQGIRDTVEWYKKNKPI
jgi:UDP-4-keto-D-QuiNAc 4-reductase